MLRIARQGKSVFVAAHCQITSLRGFSKDRDFDETANISIVGAYTPVTKHLWQQRYRWTEDTIAAARPQDRFPPKPPKRTEVVYPFSTDLLLREHYRSPWNGVRIGRLLEDMDSLAGFVAYDHCNIGDTDTRPPLLVTATVEAIRMKGTELSLDKEMKLSGRVIWTGASSMDIQMELTQGGGTDAHSQMVALFTFVARGMVDGAPHATNPLRPESQADQLLFCERQRVSDARKAERARVKATGQQWTPQQEAWVDALLTRARTKRDLPALADPHCLLIEDTYMENTFTAQPQQRNIQGRIFGGFLMRRAFELAHSAAHLFSAARPRTVTVDEIQFKAPVAVGDLLRFRCWVLRTWQPPGEANAMVHVQVQAAVIQPERLLSRVTNTFNFLFSVELRRDDSGRQLPLMEVVPGTEEHALSVCKFYGPESSARGALEA